MSALFRTLGEIVEAMEDTSSAQVALALMRAHRLGFEEGFTRCEQAVKRALARSTEVRPCPRSKHPGELPRGLQCVLPAGHAGECQWAPPDVSDSEIAALRAAALQEEPS